MKRNPDENDDEINPTFASFFVADYSPNFATQLIAKRLWLNCDLYTRRKIVE